MNLFIYQFKTKDIINLRNNLFEIKKFSINKEYSPHISLAYGEHNIRLKKELLLELPKLPKYFTLNKLSIVSVNENINKWEIINSFLLERTIK